MNSAEYHSGNSNGYGRRKQASGQDNRRTDAETMSWRNGHAGSRVEREHDLSSAYKKKAHLRTDANRNLKAFYAAAKDNGRPGKLVGEVIDPLARTPRSADRNIRKQQPDGAAGQSPRSVPHEQNQAEDGTRHFSIPSQEPRQSRTQQHTAGTARRRQQAASERYAAFETGTADGTRLFTSPGAGSGAAEAVVRPWWKGIQDGLVHLFESVEERIFDDVDLVKKQALLHKKLVDHRRGLLLALTILLITGLCAAGMYELIFVVRHVETTGNSRYGSTVLTEASGIREDMHIFSFTEEDTAERLTFYCPYIRSVKLTRQLPSTVTLTVEEDQAVYCANIFGEIVALSPGLRVLGTISEEEAVNCILLRLPGITEAVNGRSIVFAEERNDRYIRLVLEEIRNSNMNGRISYIDLRNEHDLLLHCDGMYELQLGNSADLKMKLRMADTAIADADFPQNTPAKVNLRVVNEASVQAELRLNLDIKP